MTSNERITEVVWIMVPMRTKINILKVASMPRYIDGTGHGTPSAGRHNDCAHFCMQKSLAGENLLNNAATNFAFSRIIPAKQPPPHLPLCCNCASSC